MDAPQCVHAFVPSDCMFYEMFYYQITAIWTLSCVYTFMFLKTVLLEVLLTNHNNLDAPHRVHPYVPSDCMFY